MRNSPPRMSSSPWRRACRYSRGSGRAATARQRADRANKDAPPSASSHRAGDASIHADILPGDISAAGRREEGDRGGDLFAAAIAAHRDALAPLFGFRKAVDEAGEDV